MNYESTFCDYEDSSGKLVEVGKLDGCITVAFLIDTWLMKGVTCAIAGQSFRGRGPGCFIYIIYCRQNCLFQIYHEIGTISPSQHCAGSYSVRQQGVDRRRQAIASGIGTVVSLFGISLVLCLIT